MIRTFIAIPLSENLKESLLHIQNELLDMREDIRAVGSDNIHITLRFLGDIQETIISELSDILYEITKDVSLFKFTVREVGAFPSTRKARIIWAGVDEGGDKIVKLQEDLSKRLTELGFEEEKRGFTPHITLGRIKKVRKDPELENYFMENRDLHLGDETCERVCLIKSTLTPDGAVYDEIHSADLKSD